MFTKKSEPVARTSDSRRSARFLKALLPLAFSLMAAPAFAQTHVNGPDNPFLWGECGSPPGFVGPVAETPPSPWGSAAGRQGPIGGPVTGPADFYLWGKCGCGPTPIDNWIGPKPRPPKDGNEVDWTNPTGRRPDLVAFSVFGPDEVYVDHGYPVNIVIRNRGDRLGNPYTAHLVVSRDTLVDDADPIVATVNSMLMGPQTLTADIPAGLGQGVWHWGLYVHEVPGEVALANNSVIGHPVTAQRTALQLAEPQPIEVFTRLSDLVAPTATVRVENVGTAGSALLYQAAPLTAAPWLTINPDSGFAVAGVEGQDVVLSFNHAYMDVGRYETVVRFNNLTTPGDYQDLPVALVIGNAKFNPGDALKGQIANPAETDLVVFDAVKGMKLAIHMKTLSGNLAPRVTVIDPDGAVEKTLKFHSRINHVKKVVRLNKSGEYALRISARAGTSGAYRFRTDRDLPKKAGVRKVLLTSPQVGDEGVCPVLILPGAVLEFAVKPNAEFQGPLVLALVTPDGGHMDVSANSTPEPDGVVRVSDLHLTDCGRYDICVFGFGGGNREQVRVKVLPVQPPKGGATIYLN